MHVQEKMKYIATALTLSLLVLAGACDKNSDSEATAVPQVVKPTAQPSLGANNEVTPAADQASSARHSGAKRGTSPELPRVSETGVIKGSVKRLTANWTNPMVNSPSTEPCQGVHVVAYSSDGQKELAKVVTGEDGRFRIEGLADGVVTVKVEEADVKGKIVLPVTGYGIVIMPDGASDMGFLDDNGFKVQNIEKASEDSAR
jgi:hypothetical protein